MILLRSFHNIIEISGSKMLILKGSSTTAVRARTCSIYPLVRHYSAVPKSVAEGTSTSGGPVQKGFEDLDKPIKFTTSAAAEWSAEATLGGSMKRDMPWIQPEWQKDKGLLSMHLYDLLVVSHRRMGIVGVGFHFRNLSTSSCKSRSDDSGGKNEEPEPFIRKLQSFLESLKDQQQIIVSFSLGAFLLYFLALREESDLDEAINVPVWEKVRGIDPQTAARMIEYDRQFGIDTKRSEQLLESYKRTYLTKEDSGSAINNNDTN